MKLKLGKIIITILFGSILMNCATIHHHNPGRPLKKGEYFITAGIIVPVQKFEAFSLQMEHFFGIGNETNLGLSFYDFFFLLPGSFTISKYTELNSGYFGYSFILNDLFERTYNPMFEAQISFFYEKNEFVNGINLGMGYYPKFSPLQSALGESNHNFESNYRWSPITQIDFGYKNYGGSLRYNGNVSRYYIQYYNDEKFNKSNSKQIKIKATEIDTVITEHLKERFEILVIEMKNGNKISIRGRDPYSDCHGCGLKQRSYSAYLGKNENKIYWVVMDGRSLGYLEFDLNEIKNKIRNKEDFILSYPSDYINEKISNYNQILESFSFNGYYQEIYQD